MFPSENTKQPSGKNCSRVRTPSRVQSPLRHSESGAAMVEFAFSAMAFFVFMIVTFEAGIIGWRSLTAQYIASATVREAAMYAGEEGAMVRDCGIRLGQNVFRMLDYSIYTGRRLGLNIPNRCQWIQQNVQICGLEQTLPFFVNQASCKAVHPDGTFAGEKDFIAVRIRIPTRFVLQAIEVDVVGWAAARNEEFNS